MSLIITVKGVSFAGSGLPALVPMVYGFPRAGLRGLYLFEEGEKDQPHAGAFLDSSGNGAHAFMRPGWAAATARNFGIEGGDGGISIASPLTFGDKGCLVFAASVVKRSPVTAIRYPMLLCANSDAPPGPATGSTASKGLINTFIPPGVSGNDGTLALYRASGITAPGVDNRLAVPGSINSAYAPAIFGMSWNGAEGPGVIKMSVGRREYTTTQAIFAAGDSITFGVMPIASHAEDRILPGAKFLLAAFYSDPAEAVLDAAISAARVRLQGRGVNAL